MTTLQEVIDNNLNILLSNIQSNEELVLEIQRKLHIFGIYPGGRWLDGDYGPRTKISVVEFCEVTGLNNIATGKIDSKFAKTLLSTDIAEFRLKTALNRELVYQVFKEEEAGFNAEKLAILDKLIQNSPFAKEIDFYPVRLKEKPDDIDVISFGDTANLLNPSRTITFTSYPTLGQLPTIDGTALNFLHPDIKEACVCVGSFSNNEIKAHWLGKNALDPVEFWSATKIIPLLNLVSKVNSSTINCDVDNCLVRSKDSSGGSSFFDMAVDVVSYQDKIGSSNSLAAMFKRFETFSNQDKWLKKLTGNNGVEFKGNYSENAFIASPELFDRKLGRVVLSPATLEPRGSNSVSAYDLTRVVTTLAWHHHLPTTSRIPGAQWDSLESIVRAMGYDRARYVDAAIARLGLQDIIKDPVIISKLGFGRSNSRDRTELTYTAFVQFIDRRPKKAGEPSRLRMFALSLRAAKDLNDFNEESRVLDARVAAEVTEIIRRIVTEELA